MKKIIAFLFLSCLWNFANAQDPVIKYDPGMAVLPDYCVSVLMDIMKGSLVTEIVVTSERRTPEKQVELMYDCAKIEQCSTYGDEGDAVLAVYEANKKADATVVKAKMLTELLKQLDSAHENETLMHVRTDNEFIVFDISQTRMKPVIQVAKFEEIAMSYSSERIKRFLGTEKKDVAFHFEIINPGYVKK